MIHIRNDLKAELLTSKLDRFWNLSARKLEQFNKDYDFSKGSPVCTVDGIYTSRSWTEWTMGFVFGSSLLQFDATGQEPFLQFGRENTLLRMPKHLTHMGVHDHGFNHISTFGQLLRMIDEGKLTADPWEKQTYKLALRCSGAVQARRWTPTSDGGGFIYSFNGPHSLFADTIRSMRSLAVAHRLGHTLTEEQDRSISLLDRLIDHTKTTADYSVYYGRRRDAYDISGRVAHESIFNINNGVYRCPNSQQGYSPFTTWTRGLAWIMLGFAEQLEFFDTLAGHEQFKATMLQAARASCDFYIDQTPTDGVPYWDTGAPLLAKMGDYLDRPADPFNDHEPVDSSAAAIAAQGLLRLGHYLSIHNDAPAAKRYWQAGLTVIDTLLNEPYLSTEPEHQGLILHSVYHRPNNWDHIPPGRKIPCGESSWWGDYHAREAALYLQRIIRNEPYLTFWGPES